MLCTFGKALLSVLRMTPHKGAESEDVVWSSSPAGGTSLRPITAISAHVGAKSALLDNVIKQLQNIAFILFVVIELPI